MTRKTCTKCGVEKSISQFYKKVPSKDGLSYVCKQCNAERNRINRAKRRAKLYNNDPIVERLMVVYKLNKEEAVWWTSQWQGYCPLCGDDTDKPVVDHCHQSEEVRGLICNNCNVALGLIHDSVDTLLNMIEYLE